ncbi:MAG: RsmE family RNA methyltransferase [Thermogutta sp.]
MSDRFFVGHPIEAELTLTGPEAHHLIHVMRGRVGDRVVVFDGEGHEAVVEIAEMQKKAAVLRFVEWTNVSRELPMIVRIASPLPKGERERFLVEKLTELGVSTFTPLITHRTVVRPDDQAVKRLRRWAIEASKQCGRNHLMRIESPVRWETLLQSAWPSERRLFAHPFSHSQIATLPSPAHHGASEVFWKTLPLVVAARDILAAVGPEGGFTDEEFTQAIRAGWQQIDLGPRVLRVETAAIVLATMIGTLQQVRMCGLEGPGNKGDTPPS